jgi:hypothetical protein
MKIETKSSIVNGKASIPKGLLGFVVAVTNSEAIKKNYQLDNPAEWCYLVEFPKFGKFLCSQSQLSML